MYNQNNTMNISDKIIEMVKSLPESKQSEVLDFIDYIKVVLFRFPRTDHIKYPTASDYFNSPNQYEAVVPPSIKKSLPVINPPPGPINKSARLATSSGVPARPTGEDSIMRL